MWNVSKPQYAFILPRRKFSWIMRAIPPSREFAYLKDAARVCWDKALDKGRKHGYRTAQVTVLAPTGAIAFLMDCDTTGVEPDIALVKYKLLAGGGMLK